MKLENESIIFSYTKYLLLFSGIVLPMFINYIDRFSLLIPMLNFIIIILGIIFIIIYDIIELFLKKKKYKNNNIIKILEQYLHYKEYEKIK